MLLLGWDKRYVRLPVLCDAWVRCPTLIQRIFLLMEQRCHDTGKRVMIIRSSMASWATFGLQETLVVWVFDEQLIGHLSTMLTSLSY